MFYMKLATSILMSVLPLSANSGCMKQGGLWHQAAWQAKLLFACATHGVRLQYRQGSFQPLWIGFIPLVLLT